MAGIGAAHALLEAGCSVELVERQRDLGGLAGSFEQDGAFYPIGYHHILATDRTLRSFLRLIGAARDVRWRRVSVLFELGDRLHDLGSLRGFLGFPLSWRAKAGFISLMIRAFARRDWSSWKGRPATDLVDQWAGKEVREAIFEPLARLKFRCSLSDLSAAWLGARLHAREGATPLGYIPGTNWTKVLCDGMTRRLERLGCVLHREVSVTRLDIEAHRVRRVQLSDGRVLDADVVVSTLPTVVHSELIPVDETPELRDIRYTALISAVCVTRQRVNPNFYWLNLGGRDHTACAIFQLSSLNPTIGLAGDTCLNFVTHLADHGEPLFRLADHELIALYREDARVVLGLDLRPDWVRVSRVARYSPIFGVDYRNPPVRSVNLENLYYAGNYRTYPAVASTGTALAAGIDAAQAILATLGSRRVRTGTGPRRAAKHRSDADA
jgi:protoporphyrinogen oxidase